MKVNSMKDILKISATVVIHFGTFKLADDGYHEPVDELNKIMANSEKVRNVSVLKNGGSLKIQ